MQWLILFKRVGWSTDFSHILPFSILRLINQHERCCTGGKKFSDFSSPTLHEHGGGARLIFNHRSILGRLQIVFLFLQYLSFYAPDLKDSCIYLLHKLQCERWTHRFWRSISIEDIKKKTVRNIRNLNFFEANRGCNVLELRIAKK